MSKATDGFAIDIKRNTDLGSAMLIARDEAGTPLAITSASGSERLPRIGTRASPLPPPSRQSLLALGCSCPRLPESILGTPAPVDSCTYAPLSMIPKERHRERVLSSDEEAAYLAAAPPLLKDVASVLIDCALRPEEVFLLRWEPLRDRAVHILHGKTESARRTIPLSDRAAAAIESRRQGEQSSPWVFAAPTGSGHIEKSSLKKQHLKAVKESKVPAFVLYELRHTCLTSWAEHMDPYTLAYLAGHSDFAMTKRYVHPQEETVRKAMEKARGGHTSGHATSKKGLGRLTRGLHKLKQRLQIIGL